METRYVTVLSVMCLGSLAGTPALAHHSFAAYDQTVTKEVNGTLKEFDWNAPHSGMTIVYLDESGKMQEVSVTTGAPATISRQGFRPKDFHTGDKVRLSWHPSKNGSVGGDLVTMTLEDGRVLHGGGLAGPPPASGSGPPAAPGKPPAGPPPSGPPSAGTQ